MKSARLQAALIAFTLTLFVTLFSISSHAQTRCVELFAKAPYADAFKEVSGLGSFSDTFVRQIERNPSKFNVQSLESGMKLFDKMTKAYFEKAKIQYELHPETITIENLKDRSSYELNYFAYELKGAGGGDSVSRMLNGVQLNSNLKDYSIQFILDPLFSLRGDSGAIFSWSRKKIIFGLDVLTDMLLKKRETLRHEIQHYFEQIKLFKGEMTLARLEILNENVPDIWYERQLSADELETHLRDLRFAINQLKNKNSDEQHRININQDIQILQTSILRIKKTARDIEAALKSTKFVVEEQHGLQYVLISLPNDGHAFVYLNGLVAKNEFNNQALIKERLMQVLSWSKQRTDVIQKEAQSLMAQLDSL